MTHEEAVTFHVAQAVRSYRDLPMLLYHFQTKERDEPRPRAGVLRTREFIMKDSYSFDRDEEGLRGDLRAASSRPTTASSTAAAWSGTGCESDVGMMGGTGAHEYMAPCPAGENDVALAPGLRRQRRGRQRRRRSRSAAAVDARAASCTRPAPTTIEAVAGQLGVPRRQPAQGLPGRHRVARARHGLRARRPPRQRDQADQRAGRGVPARRSDDELPRARPASSGPARDVAGALRRRDRARAATSSAPTAPTTTCVVERRRPASASTSARVEAGDTVGGKPIRIEPAIEIGNIFKLGTRYSEPLGATYLDENGKEQLDRHGLLRHRPGAHRRGRRRAVRRRAGHLVAAGDRALGRRGRRARQARHARARGRRGALRRAARRPASTCCSTTATPAPGEKFADAELLGVPLRLTVGKRSLESGAAEAQVRRGRADHEGGVPLRGRRRGGARAVAELP